MYLNRVLVKFDSDVATQLLIHTIEPLSKTSRRNVSSLASVRKRFVDKPVFITFLFNRLIGIPDPRGTR